MKHVDPITLDTDETTDERRPWRIGRITSEIERLAPGLLEALDMGYSTDDSVVRVDFFRPDGKWEMTRAIKWTGAVSVSNMNREGQLVQEAFAKSLEDYFENVNVPHLDAVCIEPFHAYKKPVMLKAGTWGKIGHKSISPEPTNKRVGRSVIFRSEDIGRAPYPKIEMHESYTVEGLDL